ncbi:neurotrophin 1 isoform X2 [Bradysia coprophila]|uniref:neurotrophin 1 isoform X2 n=1 Tax=Bradysia coprophila TaxID=38358 RepID=UPI00187D82FA|nr:neurotrophin 1 isoform X2 [Bradysia coprophila]
MNLLLFISVLCVPFLPYIWTSSSSELADFQFDGDNDRDVEITKSDGIDRIDVNWEDRTSDSGAFDVKEQRIRDSLAQATKDVTYMKQFAQILPIMRTLTKQQRLVLASLISAQASGRSNGNVMNFAQVEELFGDRKTLLLPIIFDIANLVRSAGTSSQNTQGKMYQEHEAVPDPQYLRRSFRESLSEATNIKNNRVINTTESEITQSNIKDDRLQIEESNGSIKTLLPQTLSKLMEQSSDARNFHERKLNMSNFQGKTDQIALESRIPLNITLPRSLSNISLEQYEHMALSDLNDTVVENDVSRGNGTEDLPTPEMLISRYRVKNPYRKNTIVHPHTGIDLRTCERFGTLCLRVEDYPMQQIMGSIRRHKHAMSALLAEYIDKEEMEQQYYLQEIANNKRREDDEMQPSGMCPSVIRYARPQKARSASGEWKYIVNTGQHTQTLRLEKCGKPEESCTYLTDNFRSRCVQIYNYHRLLSWDNTRGLHIDIFKVPTCCSCHIDGYREKFPPINSYNADADIDDYRFSASNIHTQNTHYSTIVSDDSEDNNGDDGDSIAYQYSNGFKRSPSKYNKYADDSLLQSSTKSYLRPPSDEYSAAGGTFKRGPSGKRRRPIRTNIRDQVVGNSDFLPDIIPAHDILTERSTTRRKSSTTPLFTTTTNESTKRVSSARLPSISTASTSSVDLGKRVNYNYHPIIDFFGDSVKGDKEIDDRIGYSQDEPSWKPLQFRRSGRDE